MNIGNSNIVSLCSTLLVRAIVGPLVDRMSPFLAIIVLRKRSHCYLSAGFGPRKVMAGLLIIGAIPSGLAGTVSSAQGLYVIRFFIGMCACNFLW